MKKITTRNRTSDRRSTIFEFDPAHAGFSHFGVATLCRCSQHGVMWGRLGLNGVETGGRGYPSPEMAEDLGREVEEVLLFSLSVRWFPTFWEADKRMKIGGKMARTRR